MRNWKGVFSGVALGLLATPAWAHSSTGVHTHGEELVLVVLLGVVLAAVLLLRRFTSATTRKG